MLFIVFFMGLGLLMLAIVIFNERQSKPGKKEIARQQEVRRAKAEASKRRALETRPANADVVEDNEAAHRMSESALRVPPADVKRIEAVAPRNDGFS